MDREHHGEDEYRDRNRAFRRQVLRTILADPTHPLRFLVTMQQRFARTPRTLFDAGHVVPVAVLRRRGTTLERLAVQRRSANRAAGATPIRAVVDVAGVPVDYDSLRVWSRHVPALRGYLTGGRRTRGWSSRTGTVAEVPVVLELPGTARVLRPSARPDAHGPDHLTRDVLQRGPAVARGGCGDRGDRAVHAR